MTEVILDTNFIFGLISYRDLHHSRATEIFSKLKFNCNLIIPYIAVSELIVSGEEENFAFICKKLFGKFTYNNDDDLDFINSIDLKMKKSLKANDCLILALCKRYNARLITFDKKLEKASRLI